MKNIILFLFFIPILSKSQNTVTTITPVGAFFLNIAPDPRAFGMGNLTASTGSSGAASLGNPGRVPFSNQSIDEYGFDAYAAYTPIATNLSKNIHALNLSTQKGLGKGSFAGFNIQYFSLGETQFYDEQAASSGDALLQEYAIGMFYAKKFSDELAMGITAKVVVSSLSASREANRINTSPGSAFAVDYGIYGKTTSNIGYGLTLTNIGTKITYTNNSYKSYLPMNLKLGGSYKCIFNDNSYLLSGLELSKPLVPSDQPDETANTSAINGASESIPAAIISSFIDSPTGFAGEFEELGISLGTEFCFENLFMIRTGFFSQGKQVINGGYFTLGAGFVKKNVSNRLQIDIAYAIPTKSNIALRGNFKIGIGLSLNNIGR